VLQGRYFGKKDGMEDLPRVAQHGLAEGNEEAAAAAAAPKALPTQQHAYPSGCGCLFQNGMLCYKVCVTLACISSCLTLVSHTCVSHLCPARGSGPLWPLLSAAPCVVSQLLTMSFCGHCCAKQ
jgi:hypothetical protein